MNDINETSKQDECAVLLKSILKDDNYDAKVLLEKILKEKVQERIEKILK